MDILADKIEEERIKLNERIIQEAVKEWDRSGSGYYKHFILDYWKNYWDRITMSN